VQIARKEVAVSVAPFRIEIDEEDVVDLRRRLKMARFPAPVRGLTWEDGTSGDYLRELVGYWGDEYRWRDREARLNEHEHRLANIDGVQVHFILARSDDPNAIPLLLLGGWPSTFVQMLDIIPHLTSTMPRGLPSFHVVAATLPGYPFSEIPREPGMSFPKIADLMNKLMVEELGFDRYGCRGSDQGVLVQRQICLKHRYHVIGVHRSGITPYASPMPQDLSVPEVEYQKKAESRAQQETLYARIQALRPETLAPALSDSPVALASWVIEKFQRWGDCKGGSPDRIFGRDKLLDNLSLLWFTGAGAASIRLYREVMRDLGLTGRVEVPTAILVSLNDGISIPAPRKWAERTHNVVRWNYLQVGGHFPEWEVPELVAADLKGFFAELAT
jgi:pimeloyl-ACP methyl ester carboxylesterase